MHHRFDPIQYPLVITESGQTKLHPELYSALSTAAIVNNFKIIMNGLTGKGKYQRLCCDHCHAYQDQSTKKWDDTAFKYTSLTNDRKNNRHEGNRNCPRRGNTSKAKNTSFTCGVCFIVYHDEFSYYVTSQRHNSPQSGVHAYHSPKPPGELKLSSKAMPKQLKDRIIDDAMVSARVGTTHSLLNKKLGMIGYISRAVVKSSRRNHVMKAFEGDTDYDPDDGPVEGMMKYLEKVKANVMSLVALPLSYAGYCDETKPAATKCTETIIEKIRLPTKEGEPQTFVTLVSERPITSTEPVIWDTDQHKTKRQPMFNSEQLKALQDFTVKTSLNLQIGAEYKLLLGIGWVLPVQHRVALAFGHTLGIDTTFKTCRYANFRMFTVTAKDTMGNTYTLLRCGMPHEKVWMLRYVIMDLIPRLFGKTFCNNVRAIVSDGDWVLIGVIDSATECLYVNATRIRCGWHIVDRTWDKYVKPNLVCYRHVPKEWKTWFTTVVQKWMYSWMKPLCHTEDEYITSKALLLSFLKSPQLVQAYYPLTTASYILGYLESHVFPHEQHYCFYKRTELYNFEIYSNSAHESQHHAVKYSSNALNPNDDCHLWCKKCVDYDVERFNAHLVEASCDVSSQKLYTADYNNLTQFGAKIMVTNETKSDDLVSQFCVETSDFLVMSGIDGVEDSPRLKHRKLSIQVEKKSTMRNGDKFVKESDRIFSFPTFLHIWRVTLVHDKVSNDSYLVCTCRYYKRCGLVCPHMLHVYKNYLLQHMANQWSYSDVAPCWWSIFNYLIRVEPDRLPEDQRDLISRLLAYNQKDLTGPTVQFHNTSFQDIAQKFPPIVHGKRSTTSRQPISVSKMPLHQRVYGWKPDYVLQSYNRYVESTLGDLAVSLLQEGFSHEPSFDLGAVCRGVAPEHYEGEIKKKVHDILNQLDIQKHGDFYNELIHDLDRWHDKAAELGASSSVRKRKKKQISVFAASDSARKDRQKITKNNN